MEDTHDPADIAAGLHALDVSGPLDSVRAAYEGSQTADAALWLSTRITAAMKTYAGRIGALAPPAEITDIAGGAEEGVA